MRVRWTEVGLEKRGVGAWGVLVSDGVGRLMETRGWHCPRPLIAAASQRERGQQNEALTPRDRGVGKEASPFLEAPSPIVRHDFFFS